MTSIDNNKWVIENLEETESIFIKKANWDEYDIVTDKRLLGTYSTKGSAVKVMDMICDSYQYLQECKYTGIGVNQPEFVFQMPQDSEV